VFDGAHAETSARVELDADAVFIGWDLVRLGRTASGERFERGALRQRFELVRDHALIWTERSVLDGADALVTSRAGLNACPMFGTFVVAAPLIADDLLAGCRRVVPDDAAANDAAVTRLPGVLVARWRGRSAEAARRWFGALWSVARPALLGRPALPPRIWST